MVYRGCRVCYCGARASDDDREGIVAIRLVQLKDIPRDRGRLERAIDSFRPDLKDGPTRRRMVRVMATYERHPERFALRDVCASCGLIRGVGFVDEYGRVSQCDPRPSDPGVRIRLDGTWFCTSECEIDLRQRQLEMRL